jgi:hypothetical protein
VKKTELANANVYVFFLPENHTAFVAEAVPKVKVEEPGIVLSAAWRLQVEFRE